MQQIDTMQALRRQTMELEDDNPGTEIPAQRFIDQAREGLSQRKAILGKLQRIGTAIIIGRPIPVETRGRRRKSTGFHGRP